MAERGVQLGHVATDAKSNEVVAIRELLDVVDIEGAVVSIDALGCETVDKGHGGLEVRRVPCSDEIGRVAASASWKGLKSLVMLVRDRSSALNLTLLCKLPLSLS